MRINLRAPSATTLIAATALFVAMGGVSSAAVLTSDTTTDTQLIHKLAPTLSVKYAKNAGLVGGRKVLVFSKKLASSTSPTVVLSVDGIVLKASCDGSINPTLTIENDVVSSSSSAAMFGGSTSSGGGANFKKTDLGSSPVDLSNGQSNGGGDLTVLRKDGRVITVQWALTGSMGTPPGNSCYFGGSAVAS